MLHFVTRASEDEHEVLKAIATWRRTPRPVAWDSNGKEVIGRAGPTTKQLIQKLRRRMTPEKTMEVMMDLQQKEVAKRDQRERWYIEF